MKFSSGMVAINICTIFALILTTAFTICIPPAYARGGAANLLNSPGYQRAQKEARDNYLRQYNGGQQVVVRKKRRRPH
jgi:hypothetical protein